VLTSVATASAEAPRVVASLVPVHALVAGVMRGVGTPTLLLRGGSPHTATLRPSEARALQDADVVFWVGEDLEAFLARPLKSLPRGARVVALSEAAGVDLLALGDDHDHDHAVDLHIWLDPANAQAMVAEVVATLSAADPANAARYRANGAAVREDLAALDVELRQVLAPISNRPYVVFHDAYRYFERRYGLTPAGAIAVSPDRRPGARTLRTIRARIVSTGALCVFTEPQFEPAVVRSIVAGTGARTGVLDPLGAGLDPGPGAYATLMRNLAGALAACLEPVS